MFVVTKFTDDPEGPIYQLPKESVGDVDAIVRYFFLFLSFFFLSFFVVLFTSCPRSLWAMSTPSSGILFLLLFFFFLPIYQLRKESLGDVDAFVRYFSSFSLFVFSCPPASLNPKP